MSPLERIKEKESQIEELSKSIEALEDDNRFLRERLKELKQGKRRKMDYTKTNAYKEAIIASVIFDPYFTIIDFKAKEFTIKSNNTGHTWIIEMCNSANEVI